MKLAWNSGQKLDLVFRAVLDEILRGYEKYSIIDAALSLLKLDLF
jgi:hypothetical protein